MAVETNVKKRKKTSVFSKICDESRALHDQRDELIGALATARIQTPVEIKLSLKRTYVHTLDAVREIKYPVLPSKEFREKLKKCEKLRGISTNQASIQRLSTSLSSHHSSKTEIGLQGMDWNLKRYLQKLESSQNKFLPCRYPTDDRLIIPSDIDIPYYK